MLRRASTAILLVWLLVFPTSELLRRDMGTVAGTPSDHLAVIGDSISAGIGPQGPTWPVLMQRQTGVPVKNLSRPGAGVADAQLVAAQVTSDDTVVLIEIGGNDLLGDVSSGDFGRTLESLLSTLATPGRTLVMFELPLLPHKIEYGQIQRRLADRYDVFLIPKRYFTSVINGADATSDGLHLSEVGARRMAALVAKILTPGLNRPRVCLEPYFPRNWCSGKIERVLYPARRAPPVLSLTAAAWALGFSAQRPPASLRSFRSTPPRCRRRSSATDTVRESVS